jgi:dinuclear metal center YbgI/SA1388 family protein
MILKDIIEIIEKEYPKHLASDWDNVGLLAGKETNDIKTVLVTLDITPKVVEEAVKMKADLILSHHPLLFGGVKNFREDNEKMNMYVKIIRNNISVYSAHTNMDTAKNGINQRLAELFEFSDIEVLEDETGLGRIGNIKEIKLKDFCKIAKEKLNTPNLRVSGNLDSTIKRVAVGSGSCGDYIPLAIKKGADLMMKKVKGFLNQEA